MTNANSPNRDPWSDQEVNTTAVYVDDVRTEQFPGNELEAELTTITRVSTMPGVAFFERVVFGNGRVALRFRTIDRQA